MSTPKRGTKATPQSSKAKPNKAPAKKASASATLKTSAKSSAKPSPKNPSKAAAKPSQKASVKAVTKKAVKKIAKKSASKTVKSAAQKVAKKVAKIISKIVAKKKSAAKKPVLKAAPAKTTSKTTPKVATKSATKVVKKTAKGTLKKAAGKLVSAVSAPFKGKTKPTRPASRRPKSFSGQEAELNFGFPTDTPELPELYGEDRLVLMTKDPEYLFAYWEITPEKRAEGERAKRRNEEYREAVRLNWTARDIFERNFAVLPVALDSRKWYLRVPFSGLAYQIELGWLGESGHFIALMASNPSDAPESWNATRRRLKDAAVKNEILERTLEMGQPQGSSELVAQALSKIPLPYDWNFPGPGSLSSSGTTKRKTEPRASKHASAQ